MRKINIISFIFLFSLLFSCSNNQNNSKENNKPEQKNEKIAKIDKQLNIAILLDLSDRIDKDKFHCNPEHYQRDIEIIDYFTELFKSEMDNKGAYNAKGKIKVIFSPTPDNSEINQIVSSLNIDLSKLDTKGKKNIFDNISTTFHTNLENIYTKTIESKQYIGADIWRFFKNNVKDYCIENDEEYRNILVILTDGYIYHPDSKQQEKNRTSYIGRNFIGRFRNNSKWKDKFEKQDYGLIDSRNGNKDLSNLEILVLEVTALPGKKVDEDIIKTYLEKWFTEMGVEKFNVYNSDLPEYTKKRIENFIAN